MSFPCITKSLDRPTGQPFIDLDCSEGQCIGILEVIDSTFPVASDFIFPLDVLSSNGFVPASL